MKNVVIEIDGVRHRLTKGEVDCYKCSLFGCNYCKVSNSYICMVFREKHERLHFELENK